LEVRRILHENMRDFEIEMGNGPYAPPATPGFQPEELPTPNMGAPLPPEW